MTLVLSGSPPLSAPALATLINAELVAQIATLNATIAALDARVAAVEANYIKTD